MICGEVRCYGQGTSLPANPRYANQILKSMEDDGCIRRYEYPDGKKVFRPNRPKGENEMSCISSELWNHFSLMAGSEDRRYKGTKKDRLKPRGLYRSTEMLFDTGITCDFINIAYNEESSGTQSDYSVFTSSGAIDELGNMFGSVPEEKPIFISSRLTRSLVTADAKAPRDLMYRSIGTLISGNTVYFIYHVNAVNEMWWPDVERQISEALKRKIEENVPAFSRNNIKLLRKSAIFYFTSEAVFRKFILTLRNKKENRVEPDAVYSLSYGIYLSGNAGDITKMLLVPKWKEKTNLMLSKIFGATPVKGKKHDLETDQGIPIYNLLCCNMTEIKKLKGLITKRESIVIIHPWMRDTVEELYEGKPEIFEITDDIFRKMLDAVM